MTPEERGLLGDVIANPDDDAPRLIYADWLEDNGRAWRGELIRLQVAIHRRDPAYHLDESKSWRIHDSSVYEGVRRAAGLVREWHIKREAPYLPGGFYGLTWRRGFVEEVRCNMGEWVGNKYTGATVSPLARCHPIRVVQTNNGPIGRIEQGRLSCEWWQGRRDRPPELLARHEIPPDVYDLLPGQKDACVSYPTIPAAQAALSTALIAWARRQ